MNVVVLQGVLMTLLVYDQWSNMHLFPLNEIFDLCLCGASLLSQPVSNTYVYLWKRSIQVSSLIGCPQLSTHIKLAFSSLSMIIFATLSPLSETERKLLRGNISAAASAAHSSGTLCAPINTSLWGCVQGSAWKTGEYCHLSSTARTSVTFVRILSCTDDILVYFQIPRRSWVTLISTAEN